MRLGSLHIRNFLSFPELKLIFKDGLFLVDGYNYDNNSANGAGKSAIFDAVVYAIYGKTPRNCRLDEFIKNDSNQDLKIIFVFERNNDVYKVVRARNPDDLSLFINDQKFTDFVDNSELTLKIIYFFGLSYNTFINSVYFPQNRFESFLIQNDEGKKRILTEMLALGIFDSIFEDVKKDLKKFEQDLVLLQNKHSFLLQQQKSIERDIVNYDSVIKDKEVEKEKERLYLERKNESLKSQIVELLKNKEKLEIESNKKEGYENLIKELEIKRKKIEDINSKMSEMGAKIESSKKQCQKRTLEKNELTDFLRRNICYTCGQKIYETDRINGSLKKIQDEIDCLDSEVEELYKKKRSLKEVYDKHKPIIDVEYKRNNDLYNQAVFAKKNLVDFDKRMDSIKNEIEENEKNLAKVDDKYASTNKFEETKQKELEEQKVKIVQFSQDIEKSENDLRILKYLKVIFGKEGIKSAVFVQVISELNFLVNRYVSQLFELPVSLKFLLQTELKSKSEAVDKIDVELMINGKKIEFGLLSGGEKKRLILAVDFALAEIVSNRNRSNFEFMILDEVLDSLDNISKNKVMDFLEELAKKKKQIFVIDHSTECKNRFDDVLFVEKRGGNSCLKL